MRELHKLEVETWPHPVRHNCDPSDVAQWLVAQNTEALINGIKHEFGCMTLHDVIA